MHVVYIQTALTGYIQVCERNSTWRRGRGAVAYMHMCQYHLTIFYEYNWNSAVAMVSCIVSWDVLYMLLQISRYNRNIASYCDYRKKTFMHIRLENIHANRNSVWQFLFRNEEWCWIKLSEGANSTVSFNMLKNKVPYTGSRIFKGVLASGDFFVWKRWRVKIKLKFWLRICYVGRTTNSCVGLNNSYVGFTYLLRRTYKLLPRINHLHRTYFLLRSTC